MVQLPVDVAWPLNRMLSMPHGSTFSSFGQVAAVPWLMACSRATNMVVQAVFPPLVGKQPLAACAVAAGAGQEQEHSADAEFSKKDQ